MKVRVGFGLGAQASTEPGAFGELVDTLETLGFDSLWLSERVAGPAPDPVIGLAVAAGRTERMKLGTSVQVLPGRNPALLAKEWASLDLLSNGRTLPAFGLGVAHPVEQQAFGVERGERAAWFDEALPLVRRLWTEDEVHHHGERFHYEGLTVLPKPVQQPPDVWLGGRAPSELRRVGRLGDGWLASFTTPEQCAAGRDAIVAEAALHGRALDPEHYGAMVIFSPDGIPQVVTDAISKRNPDADPRDFLAGSHDELRAICERFVAVDFTKLVVVPIGGAAGPNELKALADTVMPLQT